MKLAPRTVKRTLDLFASCPVSAGAGRGSDVRIVVEAIDSDSDLAAFAGTMTMTWTCRLSLVVPRFVSRPRTCPKESLKRTIRQG